MKLPGSMAHYVQGLAKDGNRSLSSPEQMLIETFAEGKTKAQC